MQTIKHTKEYKFIHPIFEEFEKLYTAFSNNDGTLPDCSFDTPLKPFENIFNTYGNCKTYLKYEKKAYPKFSKFNYNKKNVIVAFSGGKDSTATALYYKNKGFNVYLYHVHGLNRFFPFEQDSAEKIAEYLDLPLFVESVSLSGVSLYPDHPLKNIIISNMALQWGIENNISAFVAFGDYYTAHLDDVCFETAGDDCIEMWEIYEPAIQKYFPYFKFETPLVNVGETLEMLEHDRNLLKLAQSCVMTHRFKKYHRQRIQEKYQIKLLPNRCGTCWKCALEYIYYTEKGLLKFNKEYYKYCMSVLQRTLKQESGIRYSLDEVWEQYFFCDKSQSRYYKDL